MLPSSVMWTLCELMGTVLRALTPWTSSNVRKLPRWILLVTDSLTRSRNIISTASYGQIPLVPNQRSPLPGSGGLLGRLHAAFALSMLAGLLTNTCIRLRKPSVFGSPTSWSPNHTRPLNPQSSLTSRRRRNDVFTAS